MKICIDAGHGYGNRVNGVYDPGAKHGYLSEADIVLQWAITGKWVLRQHGISVFLTREDDDDVAPVWMRDNMANQAECTRFISLHCNSSDNESANGTETFARFDESNPNQSYDWAKLVQSVAVKTLGTKDRGVKNESQSQHDRLSVLDFKHGPSCLLEIAFLSNPLDRAELTQRNNRIAFWGNIGQALTMIK